MDKYVMKKCALCEEEKEIQLSHIIPKFVGRHLKKTSVGNIRSAEDPNKVFYPWKKGEATEFEYNSYFHFLSHHFLGEVCI